MAHLLNSWTILAPITAAAILVLTAALGEQPWLLVGCGAVLIAAVLAAVHHAEVIAHRVGEPFGTLVLALAVTVIEAALLLSLLVAGGAGMEALPRDTVYATVMIITTGVVGLCTLIGGLAHREQSFRVEGAGGGLAALIVLAVITLVLPACVLTFIGSAQAAPAPTAAAPTTPARPTTVEPNVSWHDVTTWGVEGRAFGDLKRQRWFDRFPAIADGQVTPAVWELSRDSAGMMVRFQTDSSLIWADYTLLRERLNGVNMTPIGASGLDLYARDDAGEWRWVGVARPEKKEVRVQVANQLAPGLREYAVYLPLYNGVEKLSIGVDPLSHFTPLAPRTDKPIVFYGTSITHGASASRPGMVHTAILGRRFDRSVINLGFSGNGRMDAAVGDLLNKIDAAVYVIDCLPNMDAGAVREKCIPLVNQLRTAHPTTPIVLVEDRRFSNSWIQPNKDQFHNDNHAALRECFEKLNASGVTGLFYIPGDDLLGSDAEGTIDGSHPNDLGFLRQADVMAPILRAALAGGSS